MLQVTIPKGSMWDEENQIFVDNVKEVTISLEHSLVSISKWEAKWKRSFLSFPPKTNEELYDYIKCMTITQCVDPKIYHFLSEQNIVDITNYIKDPMTATVVYDTPGKKNREILTSEVIYSYMVALQIPSEYQKWHLNRLLMLIRVCSIHNNPGKKMSEKEIMQRNAALNAERRAKMHSKG